MKKLFGAILLTSLAVLTGCSSGSDLAKKGTTKQENMIF